MKEGMKRCAHTWCIHKGEQSPGRGDTGEPRTVGKCRLQKALSQGPRSSQNSFTTSSGMETGVCHHRQQLGPW